MKSKLKRLELFDIFNYAILGIFSLTILYPFLYEIKLSLSGSESMSNVSLSIIPASIDFKAYAKVIGNEFIIYGFLNTVIRTLIATPLTLIVTILAAYPLSKKYFPNRTFWTAVFVFVMFFDGGLIPTYMIIKGLGIIDTVWALVLPRMVFTFTMLIVRNFFMTIPDSIEESAQIDGANDFAILLKIIIPISMPIIATVSLWSIVDNWNSWFDSLLYIKSAKGQVLQVVLRRIVLEGTTQMIDMIGSVNDKAATNTESIKAAAVMVTTIPIVMVYPFLQKYFVKGILVGSLKG